MNTASNYAEVANYETIRCIRDLEPIKVNINGEERYVSYDELSYNGRQLVLNIAYATTNALANDTFMYNGEMFDMNTIQEVIIEANKELEDSKILG